MSLSVVIEAWHFSAMQSMILHFSKLRFPLQISDLLVKTYELTQSFPETWDRENKLQLIFGKISLLAATWILIRYFGYCILLFVLLNVTLTCASIQPIHSQALSSRSNQYVSCSPVSSVIISCSHVASSITVPKWPVHSKRASSIFDPRRLMHVQ